MGHYDDALDADPVFEWQRSEEDPEPPGTATCRFCGKVGLLWLPPWHWQNTSGKWKPGEATPKGEVLHVCDPALDFTVVGVEDEPGAV